MLPFQHQQPPGQQQQQRWWWPEWRRRRRSTEAMLRLPPLASLQTCLRRPPNPAADGARVSTRLRRALCCPSSSSSSTPAPAAVRAWRTEAQLLAWQAARTRAARRSVAFHWVGTLLLTLLCGLDARFREALAASSWAVDYWGVSGIMAMAFFAIVAFSDPGFLPLPPLVPLGQEEEEQQEPQSCLVEEEHPAGCGGSNRPTGAGDVAVLIPDTEDGSWSSSSSPSDDDEEEEGVDGLLLEEETAVADAEVRGYTSPSRMHHGSRMRAFTVVDPLLGRADVEAAERVPGVREWLRRRHCTVCGLDRLPIRTKHCDACGRCVARFDHHSHHQTFPFLLGHTCVGAGNHVAFVLYLIFQCAFLTVTLALLLVVQLPAFFSTYLTLNHHTDDHTDALHTLPALLLRGSLFSGSFPLSHLLLAAPEALLHWPLQSLLVVGTAALWVLAHGLLLRQLKVVFTNKLTAEQRHSSQYPYLTDNGRANPFDRGCGFNMLSFLSLFYSFNKERQAGARKRRQRRQQQQQAQQQQGAEMGAAAVAPSGQQHAPVLLSRCSSSSSSEGSDALGDRDDVPLLLNHTAKGGLHSLSSTPSTLATVLSLSPTASLGGSSITTAAPTSSRSNSSNNGGSFLSYFRRNKASSASAASTAPSTSTSFFKGWRASPTRKPRKIAP